MRVSAVWLMNQVCILVTVAVAFCVDDFKPTAIFVVPLCVANLIASMFDENRSY